MSEFKLPTETVLLPSKGLLYPESSILAAGKVEMQYMSAKHEDILTNRNYIKDGSVLDRLLKALIVDPKDIDLNELLVADKNAILIAARILGYGKDYEFKYTKNGEVLTVQIDLTTLEERELDPTTITKGVNEFSYTLPTSKNVVTFKILTVGDNKKIEEEIDGMKKISANYSAETTTLMKHIITSVNGKRTPSDIREFVDSFLIAKDARALRVHYKTINPEIDLSYKPEGHTGEGIAIPVLNFFWPDSGI